MASNNVMEKKEAGVGQTQQFISADDHVLEPADLWTRRLSKSQWGDRIPRVERDAAGVENWIVDGKRHALPDRIEATSPEGRENHGASGGLDLARDASARLRAMDSDGVGFSVLYPMAAGLAGDVLGTIADPALELDCVKAYNDWLIEEWAAASPRLIPQCIVPVSSPEAMAAEIRRALGRGHKGVVIPPVPGLLKEAPHINEAAYDPVWALCQEAKVPVCFHGGSPSPMQIAAYDDYPREIQEAYRAITRPASNSIVLGNLLMSRILMRFPSLKVVLAESALGWLLFVLETQDHEFERFNVHEQGYPSKPSELFKRQCYVTGWYDRGNLHHVCSHVGSENILWSTNFPLATSGWPESRQIITDSFAGLGAKEQKNILWDNAAKLYGVAAK